MLQIQNISKFGVSVKTSDGGGSGRPNVLKLRPNSMTLMMQQELKSWPTGAKEDLSRYVQMGTLIIKELDRVHNGPDKSRKLDFYAEDLGSCLTFSVELQEDYNTHVLSEVFHTPAGTNTSTAAAPTDLPTLITLISDIRTNFNLHVVNTTPHVNADNQFAAATNPLTTVQDCVEALRQLNNVLDGHKEAVVPNASPTVLTPAQIITY